jgi:hypothetical protein
MVFAKVDKVIVCSKREVFLFLEGEAAERLARRGLSAWLGDAL